MTRRRICRGSATWSKCAHGHDGVNRKEANGTRRKPTSQISESTGTMELRFKANWPSPNYSSLQLNCSLLVNTLLFLLQILDAHAGDMMSCDKLREIKFSYLPPDINKAWFPNQVRRRLGKFNSASQCTERTIKRNRGQMASHQARSKRSRTVGRNDEGLGDTLVQQSLRDPSEQHITWTRCNFCHTIYDTRAVGGTGAVLTCMRCIPELIRNWELRGGPVWTSETIARNLLISLEVDDGWRTRVMRYLLDTGEPDLTDYESTLLWWWTTPL